MFTKMGLLKRRSAICWLNMTICGLLIFATACTSTPAGVSHTDTPNILPPTVTSSVLPPTVTLTATQELTSTLRPTFTATPAPEWVTNFATPILADIANRPADIEDTFDHFSGAWIRPEQCGSYRVKYENGEIVITECRLYHSGMHFNDFVVEVDGHFVSGTNTATSTWGFDFRDRVCKYEVRFNGNVFVNCQKYQAGQSVITHFDFGEIGLRSYATNRLLLIVKDTRFAFYLNGQPIGYFEDESISFGGFRMGLGSGDYPDIMAAFDNFKAWDITDLEVP